MFLLKHRRKIEISVLLFYSSIALYFVYTMVDWNYVRLWWELF